jgi:hypothetical protein
MSEPTTPAVEVDLGSATEREKYRRLAVARALGFAHRLDALADDFLGQGQGYSKTPEGQRAAPLVAAAACRAWAAVAGLLDPRAWPHEGPPTSRATGAPPWGPPDPSGGDPR